MFANIQLGMRNKKGLFSTFYFMVCVTIGSLLTLCSHPLSKPESIDRTIEVLPDDIKNALLSMYDGQDQLGLDGNVHKLDLSTKITPEQGMCIYNLCQEIKPQKTLEIGFAYGFSTLFFLASIESNNRGNHVAMDPFEEDYWHGIGLKKIEELNMESTFQFIPDYDIYAIPELAKENQEFDVIFIDGDHRFDYVLLDFTLCDHILAENGYIIVHDVWMPAIKKVARFIKRNRLDFQVQKDIPSPHMLIFKKISEDKRPWNHYSSF